MSEDNNVCSQIFSEKRGEGKNITILTLSTKESTWTEANIWLSTGTTIATHRVTHRCRNRVRKSGKHDKPHEVYKTSASVARTGIKHLRQLQGSTIHLKSTQNLGINIRPSRDVVGSRTNMQIQGNAGALWQSAATHRWHLSHLVPNFKLQEVHRCSPRNRKVARVLPVLHVGPYHPGLHWQMSGVRHSPPFSQCLLQTTTIQEVGQKQREKEIC